MFVKEDVLTVNEMRQQVKITVKHEIFGGINVPPTSNRRYYPNPIIIRSHMVHTKRKMRHSMIDQECLIEKVKQWIEEQPDSRIFYCPTTVKKSDENGSNSAEEDYDGDMEIKLL